MDLGPGQWHGPVLSGYGTHLVYVSIVIEPSPPVFIEVRDQVVQEWTSERSEELNEQFYANLRETYTIVIEDPVAQDDLAVVPEPSP